MELTQSEMQFELMNEFGWRRKKVDLKVWTENFYQRRYGIGSNFFLDKGWKFLLHSVYSNTARGYVMQVDSRIRQITETSKTITYYLKGGHFQHC
jgi:hypothetical protein